MTTLTWEENADVGHILEVDGRLVAYLSTACREFHTNKQQIPFPEGVTDIDELKAWAVAIYRMS